MSLNKTMLIGHVGQDPEVRFVGAAGDTNTKVATFNLATTERFKDRNGEVKENTEWHSIVAWRGLADLAERYIRKGTQLYIEGRLKTRSWQDQNGITRYLTDIVADKIDLLSRPKDSAIEGARQMQQQQATPVQQPANTAPAATQQPANNHIMQPGDMPDDDLPF